MLEADIISRVRNALGDKNEPFRTSVVSNGQTTWLDLPKQHVSRTGLEVITIDGPTLTTLVLDTDFTLDSENGVIVLEVPVAYEATVVVSGMAFGMISDEDIMVYA